MNHMDHEEIAYVVQEELRRYMKRVVSRKACPSCGTRPMIILERYSEDNEQPPTRTLKCLGCQKSFVEKIEEVQE